MRVLVAGLLGMSSVDYPGRPAAVIFTPKCNYRCPFCQNWKLLKARPGDMKEIEEVFRFIDDTAPTIEAVKITGGEPTLYPELIKEVSRYCHEKGLLFGFDSNGFLEDVISQLIQHADLISLDLKAPPDEPALMERVVGLPGKGSEIAHNTMKTLERLLEADNVRLDIRTTVVPTMNDGQEAFRRIGRTLQSLNYAVRASAGTASYTLQEFLPEHARSQKVRKIRPPSCADLVDLAQATELRDVYIKHRDAGFMIHKDELLKLHAST